MPPPPPSTSQITIAKPPNKEGPGVLPVSAAQTNATKAAPARLKVLIRRLPPGLTQAEFQDALGPDWNVGGGKVDWLDYIPGKVSKDLSKPSRPSRAYLHVTGPKQLDLLSDKFRQAAFEDARKTSKDSILLGPPTLEFAQYQRIPTGRRRNDARQGLIDQDPEFIAFLESLTNPLVKPANVDAQDSLPKSENVTVTPLIQYLRDKKAAKEKGSQSKNSKHARQASKTEKDDKKASAGTTAIANKTSHEPDEKKSGRRSKAEKNALEGSTSAKKENIKASSKNQSGNPPATSAPTSQASPAATATAAAQTGQEAPAKRTAINPASGVARMLQRDLGIARGAANRGRGRAGRSAENTRPNAATAKATVAQGSTTTANGTVVAPSEAPVGPSSSPSTLATPATPAATSSPQPRKAATSGRSATSTPAGAPQRSGSTTPSKAPAAAPVSNARPPKPNPVPAATSTQAFLKHANPSQGITEPLLEAALAPYGKILKVEIDKRKGFAFVDFAEPLGLQNAMRESPVKVAQGSVQILERKDRAAQPSHTSSTVSAAAGPTSPSATAAVPARPFAPPSGPAAARGGTTARGGGGGGGGSGFRPGARGGRGGGARGAHSNRGGASAGNAQTTTPSQPAEKRAAAAPTASANTGDAT